MSPASEPSPGPLTSVRAGVSAGAIAGLVAMGLEGGLSAAGVDPSAFVYQVRALGLDGALELGAFSTARGLDLLVAWLVGFTHYCWGGMVLGALAGLVAHPLLRRQRMVARYERLLGALLGLWAGLLAIWWARQLILPGAPFLHPGRLALAAVLLLAGQLAGRSVGWFRRRSPRPLRVASVVAVLVLPVTGALLQRSLAESSERGVLNPRNRDLPNVLVVVVDALRHDMFGFRGDPTLKTPHLDALAQESAVFTAARAQAPFTWTSFGSLLTGKLPRRHGLIMMKPGVQMGRNATLAVLLQGHARADGTRLEEGDFATAAFMTGTVSQGSGLLQGIDQYTEALVGHGLVDLHDPWSEFRSRLVPWLFGSKAAQHGGSSYVVDRTIDWLREHASRRFMGLVHLYSTHTDYTCLELCDPESPAFQPAGVNTEQLKRLMRGDEELTSEKARFIRDAYRGGIVRADRDIGLLVAELERLGLLNDTILVVTSDHGESLGEHGLWEHNWMVEENLRIPLLIRFPSRLPAGEVAVRVDQVDLVPTLLDLAGLAPLESALDLEAAGLDPRSEAPEVQDRIWAAVDGTSLVPVARGELEQVRPWSSSLNGPFQAVTDGRWKLVVAAQRVPGRSEGAAGLSCDLVEGPHDACSFLEPDHWAAWWRRPASERDALTVRLFDLEVDPAETQNLALLPGAAERAAPAWEALRALEARMPLRSDVIERSPRDAELDLFERLGYGGGGE